MKIFLIGFMAAGKTYWGRQLSQKLTIPFFDLDEHIVAHAGKSIPEIFSADGEEQFRLWEKEVLYIISESNHSFVMACGGGTPCFYNNIEYMNQMGTTIWINTPIEILCERLLKEKAQRPLIQDLTDEQLKNFIHRKFADRKIYYEQADITVNEFPVNLDTLIHQLFHA